MFHKMVTGRLIPGSGQNLTVDATVHASALLTTYAVRLQATTNCHVVIVDPSSAPATAGAMAAETLLQASDDGEVFLCGPGEKVYVTQDSAGGVLQVQGIA